MRILVATDAWRPQINGVVRTYERLAENALVHGSEITFLTPSEFKTLPCPTYPEIRLSVPGYAYLVERIGVIKPDAVHIATEGPLGWMTRYYCLKRGIPFTTSFHTRFPDYLFSRFHVPERWTWSVLRKFHNAGAGIMVATASLAKELEDRGFERTMGWTRGVDTELFRPRPIRRFGAAPVFLYVGRVAIEKNIRAFLDLELPGQKVVVGAGPQLQELKNAYPQVIFTGKKTGEDLAQCYASADVFVMPSRTETFGIVLLEAMASGLPVAAYPVTGPLDLLSEGETGVISQDLGEAARTALKLDRAGIREKSLSYSWDGAARLFLSNIETAIFAQQGQCAPRRCVAMARRPHQA